MHPVSCTPMVNIMKSSSQISCLDYINDIESNLLETVNGCRYMKRLERIKCNYSCNSGSLQEVAGRHGSPATYVHRRGGAWKEDQHGVLVHRRFTRRERSCRHPLQPAENQSVSERGMGKIRGGGGNNEGCE